MGVLDGTVVLDFTRVMSGPYCSMLLADMGTTVIKVEAPGRGDDARGNRPFQNGESTYFINLNRGKYGISVDLKSEEGREIIYGLVKKSDILLENFRPGVMDRLGLGYETLRAINPALVYGSISGFGQSGSYAKRPGFDLLAQAMSGLMSVTGWPENQPTRAGVAVGDVGSGVYCALGVLGAYVRRLKTGLGDYVDVSLTDSVIASLIVINALYLTGGELPARMGNEYQSVAPYGSFPTSDGHIIVGCANDTTYRKLAEAIGDPALLSERFRLNAARVEQREELNALIEAWTRRHSSAEALSYLNSCGAPACPIYNIADTVNDPFFSEERSMFVDTEHPTAGQVRVTNSPLRYANEKTEIRRSAPLHGQHTEEILKEYLNMTEEELRTLLEKAVIETAPSVNEP